jgi:hypothetical protein
MTNPYGHHISSTRRHSTAKAQHRGPKKSFALPRIVLDWETGGNLGFLLAPPPPCLPSLPLADLRRWRAPPPPSTPKSVALSRRLHPWLQRQVSICSSWRCLRSCLVVLLLHRNSARVLVGFCSKLPARHGF